MKDLKMNRVLMLQDNFNKLESIIESAESSDYYCPGDYDFDVLLSGLIVFMDYEIEDLMELHQYKGCF